MNARTRHLIRLALLALSLAALFFLIAGLRQIELEPGLPFSQIWQFLLDQLSGFAQGFGGGGGDGGSDLIIRIYRTIFWIALACFPFAVVMMLLDPELRRRVIRTTIVLLILLALMSFVMNRQDSIEPETTELENAVLEPPQALDLEALDVEEFEPEQVSSWLGRTISLVLGLLFAFIIFVIVRQIILNRPAPEADLNSLAKSARRAISELESGEDLQDAILRCYAEMTSTVRDVRGLRRDRDVTAREFTDVLVRAQLPPGPVHTLTALFEKARYGTGNTTPQDESAAISSLRAIVHACEELSRVTSHESQVTPTDNRHSSLINRDGSDL